VALIDTKEVIDEKVLVAGIAPAVESIRAFLEQVAKSPLIAPDGFTVTITVSRKQGV